MELLTILLALFIALGTAVVFTSLIYSGIRYAPFVPTKMRVIDMALETADLQDGQTLYELGCGDARFLIQARKQKDIKAIGIEASWVVVLLARLRVALSGQKVNIQWKNFFQEDISSADVVFCYLFPNIMEKLQEKFEKELKPGAKVISLSFPLHNWTPVKTIQTEKNKPKNFLLYVYEVGASNR